MTTCAHHGAINRPNSIEATRHVLRKNAEIGIVEIDFISPANRPGQFLASHDYDHGEHGGGESLIEWIHFLCVEKRKRLYLDAKARLAVWSRFFTYDAQERFDCTGLYALLNDLAHEVDSRHFKLRSMVWIACQDYDVSRRLFELNERHGYGWQVIVDIPYIEAYVAWYLTPLCWIAPRLQPALAERYVEYDFSQTSVVAIDCRCIGGLGAIAQFVHASNIKRGSVLVLYAFERSVKQVQLRHYTVIMMYDYYETGK